MDGEEIGQPPPPPPREESGAGSKAESLSIEETNKLRASLGLKPLKVDEPKRVAGGEEGEEEGGLEGTLIPGDDNSARHKPAENITGAGTNQFRLVSFFGLHTYYLKPCDLPDISYTRKLHII